MNQTLHDQSVVSTTDSAASDLRLMSANFGRRSAICEQRRARSGEIGRATLEGPMGFWQRKKVGKWYWKTRRENFRGNYYWNEKKKKRKSASSILPNGLVIASSVISFQLHFRLLFNAPFNKRSSTLFPLFRFFSTFIRDQIIGYVFLMIRFHRDFAWRESIPFLWNTF